MHSSLTLVVGLGKTGHSIARYLHRHQRDFIVFDTRVAPAGLAEFHKEFPEAQVFLETLPDEWYESLIEVICSPGVALEHPAIQKAIDKHIPVIGDIECLARDIHAPVVTITGTNGKSTVTTLVGEMAKAAGLKVAVAGNIGTPVLDLRDDGIDYELWVLELSSFQLELTHSLAPKAATLLNVSPDHLDRHHHMDAYIRAKQRVYHQAQTCLYNRDDEVTLPVDVESMAHTLSFGLDKPTKDNWGIITLEQESYLARGHEALLSVNALRIKGRHNWQNALAAAALAEAAGIERHHIISVLEQFKGLAHRSQWVRTLAGVDWINDSKGTNIGATLSAIAGLGGSMQGKIVLIAGGQGKGADFTTLKSPVATYARSVILIGEDAKKLEQVLHDVVAVSHAASLEQAVHLAKSQAKPGDVVLLSPACASLDMFRDFNHRGDVFTTAVEAL